MNYFFIFFFLIPSLLHAQGNEDSVYYYQDINKPVSHRVASEFYTKEPIDKIAARGGKMIGYDKEEGFIELDFKNGKANGSYLQYYRKYELRMTSVPPGERRLFMKGWFKDGKKDSLWIGYHTTGSVFTRTFYVNDLKTGEYRAFYKADSGKVQGPIEMTGYYKAGEKDSTWKKYYQSGHLSAIEKYKLGKKDSMWTKYHESGRIAETIQYQNDLPVGRYCAYYDSASAKIKNIIEEQGYFKSGKKDSIWTEYYKSGEVKSLTPYKAGLKHGAFVSYFSAASLDTVKSRTGTNKKGIPSKTQFYKMDVPDSSWTEWYPDGKIFYTEKWDNGTLLQGKSFYPLENKEYEYTEIFASARHPDGNRKLNEYIQKNVDRSILETMEEGQTIRLQVLFEVRVDGKAVNIQFKQQATPQLKRNITSLLESITWVPGKYRGRPRQEKLALPIVFKNQE
jgi:antitoxin component YwqK of YwqJK toxin-antitoxin module